MAKSILIVDDDKRLRELLEDYLVEKKLNVFLSDDFSSAIDIFRYFTFDLVIVDRMMPSGDGIDLIEVIKKSNNIPVSSTINEKQSIKKTFALGGDAYYWKDIIKIISGAYGKNKWTIPAPVFPIKIMASFFENFPSSNISPNSKNFFLGLIFKLSNFLIEKFRDNGFEL